MYEDLSTKQIDILRFMRDQINAKGYPPSVREICVAVALRSTSTVHGHLAKLEERGYIRRDPTKPRAIEILYPDDSVSTVQNQKEMIHVPIVGKVTAGQPILALENIEDTFPIPIDFIDPGNAELFILSIQGESMIDAGILDGDYVIVRQQSVAKNGDIVVALLGEEATVKRFYKENGYFRLQPENSSMEPIIAEDVVVLGKVIGVFRRL